MAAVDERRHPALLEREETGLILVDVQEAFRPVIDRFDEVIANCGLLAEGFGVLGRPVLVSEQYPKGLGHTVPELAERLPEGARLVEKVRFSACGVGAFDGAVAEAGAPPGWCAASRPTSASTRPSTTSWSAASACTWPPTPCRRARRPTAAWGWRR